MGRNLVWFITKSSGIYTLPFLLKQPITLNFLICFFFGSQIQKLINLLQRIIFRKMRKKNEESSVNYNMTPKRSNKEDRATDFPKINLEKIKSRNCYESSQNSSQKVSYFQQQSSSSRYNIKKGQFRNFLEKTNDINKIFGPVQGKQRSNGKASKMRRQISNQSFMRLSKSKQKLDATLNVRKYRQKIMNSINLEQKQIRKSRQNEYSKFKQNLSTRKQNCKKSFLFDIEKTERFNKSKDKILEFTENSLQNFMNKSKSKQKKMKII